MVPDPAALFADESSREKFALLYRYSQVGHCVSSVTHDVNNFLGAILAYAELAGLEGNQTPESRRMLQEIMTAVRRSSRLINNLTTIARRERPDIRVVQPREVMEDVLDLRRYDLKVAHVSLETDYQDALPEISVDLPKLEQAIIYVLSNAIEALEEGEKRLLKVSVLAGNGNVEFRFWNSGGAVREDIRSRMFEPFFTTKGGDHFGLGLWAARNNLRPQNGDVVYDPSCGFSIVVPR